MDNKINLTDGFFDLRINDTLVQFRSLHNNEYALIRETKELLDKAQHKFVGQTVTERELYLATMMVELSKLFQSSIVLFERGLLESGNIIIRSCLELSFKIVELINNKNFVDDMKKELASEARSTLNIINEKKLYGIVPQETVENLLSSFDLNKPKFKISASKLAEKNGLLDAYILYRLYCNECHQSIATLDEIQIPQATGVHLNGNLRLGEFSKAIYMLISVALISFPALIDKYSTDYELKNQYDALLKNFQNAFEKESI